MPPRAARDSSPSSASEVGSSDDAIDDGLPQPIRLPGNDAVATDLRFVADASRLAVATLAGKLELFDLGDSEKPVSSLTTHAKSVRALEMPTSRPGIAYSVSKDRSLAVSDLAAGKIVGRVSRAHADPCSSIACLNEGGTFLATGDDNGVVNVWDSRMIGLDPANLIKGIGSEEERKKRGLVNSWKAAGDYVSDMLWAENKKRLIAAGGDGTLAVIDPRSSKDPILSEQQPADLLSLGLIRNGSKLLVGTQDGSVSIFSWGSWDEPSDRFVGHPDSVEALAVLDEDTYVTGSGDGIVRKCSAFPNRLLAVIGAHDEGFPAERVRVGEFEGTRVVATATGHDGTVMFWDPDAEVSFGDMDGEASDEVDSDDEEDGQSNAGSSDDAEDVVADAPADGSSDDESDSSDEDMEGGDTSSEPAQGAKRKRATWTVTETTATANDEVKKEGKKKQTAAEVASDEDSDSDGADGSDSDDSGAGGARRDRKKKRVPDGKKSFTSKKGKPGAGAGFYADL